MLQPHFNPSYLRIFLFNLAILSLVRQVKSDCETCVQLSFYSCKVCYNNCQKSNKFETCSHTYCSSYSTDSNGTQTCDSYDTQLLPQNQCFKTCCGGSEQNYFSVQQLNRCEALSKKNTTIVIAVVCSIFGAIILIILICCLCRSGCNCPCTNCCSFLCDCLGGCCACLSSCLCYILKCECIRKAEDEAVNRDPINLTDIQLVAKRNNLQWQSDGNYKQLLAEDSNSCSICLSNRVNVVTRCNHCYHYDCILLWFNKNPHCPLCIADKINQVKFYCRGCCIKFVRLDLKIHKDYDKVMQEIKGPNCQTCQ